MSRRASSLAEVRPGAKIEAVGRIVDAMSAKNFREIDLILSTFKAPVSDFGDWKVEADYVSDMLRQADDSIIEELDAYFAGTSSPEPEDVDRIWSAGAFRLFISHTSANKEHAANIARVADRIGVHGFVAHDTIEPTTEWQSVIETALMTCDALVAIVTPDFIESRWCDQEVGFVMARQRPVLAISSGADPHGFLGRFQAIKASKGFSPAHDEVHAIIKGLLRNPTSASQAAEVAVKRFVRSNSFESTRQAFSLLQLIKPQDWATSMIEDVDRAGRENGQVANANQIGGESVVDALNDILRPIRTEAVPEPVSDDIPF